MLESVWCPILSHVADRQIICLAVNGYECIGSGSCLSIPTWPQNKAWISSAPAMILMRPSTIPCAISAVFCRLVSSSDIQLTRIRRKNSV